MRQTWEQWRSPVLVVLVNSNIEPDGAIDLMSEKDGWTGEAFADGKFASNVALDPLALV